MMTPNELHNLMTGKEIEDVEAFTNSNEEISSLLFRLKDGTIVSLSSTTDTSGNGQRLKIEVK